MSLWNRAGLLLALFLLMLSVPVTGQNEPSHPLSQIRPFDVPLDLDGQPILDSSGDVVVRDSVNLSGNELIEVIVDKRDGAPATVEGKLWYDDVNNVLRFWNGTKWIDTSGGSGGGSTQDLKSVLATGNSAGGNNIQMNSNQVLNASKITMEGTDGACDPCTSLQVTETQNHGGILINNTAGNQAHLRFANGTGLRWQIRTPFQESGGNQLRFFNFDNSQDVLTLDNSGNVGIGTTDPSEKLDVVGDAVFNDTDVVDRRVRIVNGAVDAISPGSADGGRVQLTSPSTRPGIIFRSEDPNNYRADIQRNTGGLLFEVHANTDDPFGTTNLYLQNGGNVGIGTTSPGGPLQIGGDSGIRFDSTSKPRLRTPTNADSDHGMTVDASIINAFDINPQGGSRANADNARINAHVQSNGNRLMDLAANDHTDAFVRVSQASSTNQISFRIQTQGSEAFRVTGDGNVGIGTSSPNVALDVQGGVLEVSQDDLTRDGHKIGALQIDYISGNRPRIRGAGGDLYVGGSNEDAIIGGDVRAGSGQVNAFHISHGRSGEYVSLEALDGAPPDGDLATNSVIFYQDEANNDLRVKWKESDGTVHDGLLVNK